MRQAEGKRVDAKMEEASITREALEKWRSRIGTKLRVTVFNEMASRDNIRKFADGIGDTNPLWCDSEYGKRTRYGRMAAPPSWTFSVANFVAQGLPGVGSFHSGTDTQYFKPILVNDVITPECIFSGFDEKPSKFAGRLIKEYQEMNYYNQKGELVTRANGWLIRFERSASKKRGKYSKIVLPHPWTEKQLRRIEEEALADNVQGSNVRYWEDTATGDELGPLVKGPLGLTDMIAFSAGAAPVPLFAHRRALLMYRRHPAWAFRDPNSMSLEPIYSVHYSREAAKAQSLPYPYDVGAQRECWQVQMLTDWMGDDGWLKRNYVEYREFVYHSDVVWIKGKITKKYVDGDGEHCVDIDTSTVNQRGADVMPGHSTVVLPSRGNGKWPVQRRLS